MKKISLLIAMLAFVATSCSKKESGICYCSYFSGDKTEYDLRSLSKQDQVDSCSHLNELADNFVGHCKLKK